VYICDLKDSNAQCSRRLIHFGTVIPAGCCRMLDICINKSWKDLCLGADAESVASAVFRDTNRWAVVWLMSLVAYRYDYIINQSKLQWF